MRYLENPSTDPHFNMAFDGYCLEAPPSDAPFFYLWRNRPSVIIGLNQNPVAEVDLAYLESEGITLARRESGGGAVYHDLGNINYTIIGRNSDLRAEYPEYMYMMRDALRAMGLPVELSGRNDILLDGRKCSGFAKRLHADRQMVHGTLMFDVDLGKMTRALTVPGSKFSGGVKSVRSKVVNLREFLPQYSDATELMAALGDILAAGDGAVLLPEGALDEINTRADKKFRTWQWNMGHSPAADLRQSRRFPSAGTVTASFSIVKGLVRSLRFEGDFIGGKPAEELAGALEGCRYSRVDIIDRIHARGLRSGDFFDGVTPEQFAELITDNSNESNRN